MVLPLTCLLSKRWPQKIEIGSIAAVFLGVTLILELEPGKYSWLGLGFGLTATFLSANATIFSGKARDILLPSEAMVSKQLGKLAFALAGLTVFIEDDITSRDTELYLWILLGVYGVLKIYDTYIASRAQFALPPLIFQNLSLLSLPLVCIAEVILFKGTFTYWQWAGVLAIILAGFLASRSKQPQLKAIR